ncbi:hypothetical protein Acel_1525 [Acidothermus cellulolyticus 11B]|uniref:Uncharacterized protein n=1 Tax=Acidothermus cellulolyticus (strain ATCC 43068 / DSM 8971 / 11B) TaxID=351607 RepID=A0LV37_ACIC1|nr:hypothetical protein Acel_1525 [Acidothermus cellulolyticus 11B]
MTRHLVFDHPGGPILGVVATVGPVGSTGAVGRARQARRSAGAAVGRRRWPARQDARLRRWPARQDARLRCRSVRQRAPRRSHRPLRRRTRPVTRCITGKAVCAATTSSPMNKMVLDTGSSASSELPAARRGYCSQNGGRRPFSFYRQQLPL